VRCTAAGGVGPCDDAMACERDRGDGFPDLVLGDGLFGDALATGRLLMAELTSTWLRDDEEGYMDVAGYGDEFGFWFGMLNTPGREVS
jgi:hypothetical protein